MVFETMIKLLPEKLKISVSDRIESTYGTNEFVEMIHEVNVNPFSRFKLVYIKAVVEEIIKHK